MEWYLGMVAVAIFGLYFFIRWKLQQIEKQSWWEARWPPE